MGKLSQGPAPAGPWDAGTGVAAGDAGSGIVRNTGERGREPIREDGATLVSLARRTDLPPRVRAVLQDLLQTTCTHFSTAMGRTLDELDLSLFKLAERAANNTQQQALFGSLGEIRLKRADAAPRFLQYTESTLASMHMERAQAEPVRSVLELVDTAVLEEDLILREIAGKAEVRNGRMLYLLAHRMAVLAETPVWPHDTLPLGPTQFTAAIRHSLRHLELDIAHRLLAYRLFDRLAMSTLGDFYERVNQQLANHRILANLQWNPGGKRPAAGASAETARDTADGAPVDEGKKADAVPQADAVAQADPVPRDAPRATVAANEDTYDSKLFDTLYRLLDERRRTRGHGAPDALTMPASSGDLQGLLGQWQRENPLPSGHIDRSASGHDHARFKRELSLRLRHAGPDGSPLRLHDRDADTIELVGLLFEYIDANLRSRGGTRSLLSRLYVPILRVALDDQRFFTQRSHPARELLNAVAETSQDWIDESDPDLTGKMQALVDSVSTEFEGDSSLFESLLGDLSQHMQLLARRSEVFERRQVEAAQGHERLEIARTTARSAIDRALRHGTPTPAIRHLLEHGWTDALALSALRHGSSSDEFRRRLTVASTLVHGNLLNGIDTQTRAELEAGLRETGVPTEALPETINRLFSTPAAGAGTTSVVGAPVAPPVFPPQSTLPATPAAAAPPAPPPPLTAQERDMLERLRSTPFGTWFLFRQNQQGDTVRRKLAWFSPLTRRCLFVNQRGARCEDRTLDQLARDIVRGEASIEVAQQASLIDRAWKAIVEALSPQETVS